MNISLVDLRQTATDKFILPLNDFTKDSHPLDHHGCVKRYVADILMAMQLNRSWCMSSRILFIFKTLLIVRPPRSVRVVPRVMLDSFGHTN